MNAADNWRLEHEDSLDLFLIWRSMGGQPPSLAELMTLPSSRVRDFQKLGVRFYKAKERKRQREKEEKEGSGVPTHPRVRPKRFR